MLNFGSVLSGLEDIITWIESTAQTVSGIFSDVDFSILYSWLPNDIVAVISAIIGVLLFLAVFGILKRVLFFLG